MQRKIIVGVGVTFALLVAVTGMLIIGATPRSDPYAMPQKIAAGHYWVHVSSRPHMGGLTSYVQPVRLVVHDQSVDVDLADGRICTIPRYQKVGRYGGDFTDCPRVFWGIDVEHTSTDTVWQWLTGNRSTHGVVTVVGQPKAPKQPVTLSTAF